MNKESFHRCFIGLGGNVGDVGKTLETTFRLLEETPGITLLCVSSYHKTIPVGSNAGAETFFLNAACEIETSLEPLALLDQLQAIEKQLGRQRDLRWGPRTIDLDIILYDDLQINHPRLQVPHPACWYRRFVLDPLVEIAAEIVHPVKGVTIQELQNHLLQQPFVVVLAGGEASPRKQLLATLSNKFLDITFEELCSLKEPTLLVWLGKEEPSTESIDFESLALLPRVDLSQADDPLQTIIDIICAATNG